MNIQISLFKTVLNPCQGILEVCFFELWSSSYSVTKLFKLFPGAGKLLLYSELSSSIASCISVIPAVRIILLHWEISLYIDHQSFLWCRTLSIPLAADHQSNGWDSWSRFWTLPGRRYPTHYKLELSPKHSDSTSEVCAISFSHALGFHYQASVIIR